MRDIDKYYILNILDQSKVFIKTIEEKETPEEDILTKIELFQKVYESLDCSKEIRIIYVKNFDRVQSKYQLILIEQIEFDEIFIIELYCYLFKKGFIISFDIDEIEPKHIIRNEIYHKYLMRIFKTVDEKLYFKKSITYNALSHMSLTKVSAEEKGYSSFGEFNKKYDDYVSSNENQDSLNIKAHITSIIDALSPFINKKAAYREKEFEWITLRSYEDIIRRGATRRDIALIKLIRDAKKSLFIWDLFIYFEVLKALLSDYNDDILKANKTLLRIQYSNSLLLSSAILQLIENSYQYSSIQKNSPKNNSISKVTYFMYRHLVFHSKKENSADYIENEYKCIRDKELLITLFNLKSLEDINLANSGMLFYLQDLSSMGIKKTSNHSVRDFIFYDNGNFGKNINKIKHYGINFFTNVILKLGGVFKVESDDESVLIYVKNNEIKCKEEKNQLCSKNEHLIGTRYIIYVPFPLINRRN